MKNIYRLLAVVLVLTFCWCLVSCKLFPQPNTEGENTTLTTPEETTLEQTTPEETTSEETTPAVTEPDFSNTPDPDGTKRY